MRKAIPKGVRFDVLKRDSFQCQYCGASAPDVLLHIDHIDPVANGGDNDITNLITSCQPCNAGKSDKTLDENTTVQKSRRQLETLQERREQLDLMMEWASGLKQTKDETVDRLVEHWESLTPGFMVNQNGKQTIKRFVSKYPVPEILKSMEIASDTYLVFDDDLTITGESCANAFDKIGGILFVRKKNNDDRNGVLQ